MLFVGYLEIVMIWPIGIRKSISSLLLVTDETSSKPPGSGLLLFVFLFFIFVCR